MDLWMLTLYKIISYKVISTIYEVRVDLFDENENLRKKISMFSILKSWEKPPVHTC